MMVSCRPGTAVPGTEEIITQHAGSVAAALTVPWEIFQAGRYQTYRSGEASQSPSLYYVYYTDIGSGGFEKNRTFLVDL